MDLTLTLNDAPNRADLFGHADSHLRLIRSLLGVRISARDSTLHISGPSDAVAKAAGVIQELERRVRAGGGIGENDVTEAVSAASQTPTAGEPSHDLDVYAANARIRPQTEGQTAYLTAMMENDLTFCLGPAGTGKTYLAVAMAVAQLKRNLIKRIVLVRPAVEAGEKLGFLPGDLQAKVNPYLRPLFDAMHDMMSFDQIRRFMQNDIVEVVPLAFMRGRTLNHAAIILDEAQNTTVGQMLMFLTRMGNGSKMIVTGDDSQIDLPPGVSSGLIDAVRRLGGIAGVQVVRLEKQDIVRHRLVQAVVKAYEKSGNSPERGENPR